MQTTTFVKSTWRREPGRKERFWREQSSRETEAEGASALRASAMVSRAAGPPVQRSVCGKSQEQDTSLMWGQRQSCAHATTASTNHGTHHILQQEEYMRMAVPAQLKRWWCKRIAVIIFSLCRVILGSLNGILRIYKEQSNFRGLDFLDILKASNSKPR